MEYWRWWVVHLWVEGFFEVFATAAIAFVFSSLGLVGKRTATAATLVAAILFMLGGVPGTFHHLYFAGTTTPIMAVGASFSALEVVPLIILGYEAYESADFTILFTRVKYNGCSRSRSIVWCLWFLGIRFRLFHITLYPAQYRSL